MSYEPERLNVRGVLWVVVATFALLAVSLGAVFLWQRAVGGQDQVAVPTDPQAHWEVPVMLLEVQEASQRLTLSGYRWVDRERGVVRIPIERAMELVAGEQRP